MIGIKGVGMTMLAEYFISKNVVISGSDTKEVFMTDKILKKCGIKVFEGFDEKNIPQDADLIIYSTAYNEKTNSELAAALRTKKKILTYSEVLGEVFNEKFGIAVAGTHGKTTTTAWLGYVLEKSGKSPSVMVGGSVPQFNGASLAGWSDTMIIEADEYQNKFKYYSPQVILLNNIDYDHPDFFPTQDDYNQVFIDFIKKIPKKGFLVANFDDLAVRKIATANCRGRIISYAINESANYVAFDIKTVGNKQYFKVKIGGDDFLDEDEDSGFSDTNVGDFSICLFGRHNIYNALAVIAASIELGIPLHELREHLEGFLGTSRRMEVLGQYRGALIIDDYAHHPTEIKATLAGAREAYPEKKIRVVFHPHTFTRTKELLKEFGESFDQADEVIVLDIYGSAREEQGGVHSEDLVKQINRHLEIIKKRKMIKYISSLSQVEEYLRSSLDKNEVVILMGAGDVFRIGENLVK